MKDIAIFVYTHSDYKDAWEPCFNRLNLYAPSFKKYVFVNKISEEIPSNFIQIIYNESLIYKLRLLSCLQQINEELVILTHEDFILYDKVDEIKIKDYVDIIDDNNISFIRLIKTGEKRDTPTKYEGIFSIPKDSDFFFAIQPTLWRKKDLESVYSGTPGSTIWEFEVGAQQYCKQNNINGYYTYYGTPKRGGGHWDSADFPYMATAIVKGKWNVSEYGNELKEVFKEYNIDPNKRGLF